MTEYLVWLLISVGGYNTDQVVKIETFKSQVQCEHVRKQLAWPRDAKCVQANVYR